jgi:DNA-binding LytR/AlgR family response regulator
MTYFVYAAPRSITTACFSVKPIPSYNGIFKTSLQHDPRQSLRTKCTSFRSQCIKRCISVLIWITFRVMDYNCRKKKQTLKLNYIDVYYFRVKHKSTNHVITLHERNSQLCETTHHQQNHCP